ncbi:cystin-1 isoform 1-T1 [Cyanocitta cristata]|uniref:cystin-1 n=1 Tax=Aphelocoma coerulescens TaxID=39617 RepID=UPI003605165B
MGSGSSRRRSAAGPAGRAGLSRGPPGTAPADSEGAAAPPGPTAPAAGGSSAEAPLQQAALSTRSPPGPENNVNHQCPESNKKPLGQSTMLYDYSEEELMASIEREYCR